MATELRDHIRKARRDRGLSQGGLAAKLGVRQSQISDLERAAVDPRLSTMRDVARALDLELMLIPRTLIPAVEGLLRAGGGGGAGTPARALYALDEPEERGAKSAEAQAGAAKTAKPAKPAKKNHPRSAHASPTSLSRPRSRAR